MHSIILICESEGRSITRVSGIVDQYLNRIGARTWHGELSNQGVQRLTNALKKVASRYMSVVIQVKNRRLKGGTKIITIGRRSGVLPDGQVPVRSTPLTADTSLPEVSAPFKLLHAIVRVSALMHDLGKQCEMFQQKLRRALAGPNKLREADYVRHELISASIWLKLIYNLKKSLDGQPSEKLSEIVQGHINPQKMRELLHAKSDRFSPSVTEWLASLTSDEAALHDDVSQLGHSRDKKLIWHNDRYTATWLLILSHHRLCGSREYDTLVAADHTLANEVIRASSHWKRYPSPLRYMVEEGLSMGAHVVPDSGLIDNVRWCDQLCSAVTDLISIKLPQETDEQILLTGSDFILRNALIAGDKLGSAMRRQMPDYRAARSVLANSAKTPGYAGDSLADHTRKVVRASRSCLTSFLRDGWSYPGLSEAETPELIRESRPPANREFSWQHDAAEMVKRQVSTQSGGFFAAICADTGKGKTRGAPLILAAAAFSDIDPARRTLRYNLCLGLRNLTAQTAHQYVHELGFAPTDLITLIGGRSAQMPDISEQEGDETGEVSDFDFTQVFAPEQGIPEDGDPSEGAWLETLSHDFHTRMPMVASILCELPAEQAKGKIRKFLQTPIACMTIDHLMPSVSPIRTNHIFASMRIMSSDIIIDEIDSYSEEDLSAICRLAFQTGMSGRRMIIMSATVDETLAAEMYENYRIGYENYATVRGVNRNVNHAVIADGIGTSATGSSLTEGATFSQTFRSVMTNARAQIRPILRRANICSTGTCDQSFASLVSDEISRLHDYNHQEIEVNASIKRVSIGLVRLARIDHLVALRRKLDTIPLSNDTCRRFIVLHGRLIRSYRNTIERRFSSLLNRKGADSDSRLQSFCMEYFADATETNIQIVVLSSPVIETGNDLDFDWAIIDPSSTRAIIQCSGRVNRHRRVLIPPDRYNIAILDHPLTALGNGGKIERPGVETAVPTIGKRPKNDRRYGNYRTFNIRNIPLPVDVRDINSLLPNWFNRRVDGTYPGVGVSFTKDHGSAPLVDTEMKLLRAWIADDGNSFMRPVSFSKSFVRRYSRQYYEARRFRRQTGMVADYNATIDERGRIVGFTKWIGSEGQDLDNVCIDTSTSASSLSLKILSTQNASGAANLLIEGVPDYNSSIENYYYSDECGLSLRDPADLAIHSTDKPV